MYKQTIQYLNTTTYTVLTTANAAQFYPGKS